jgi:pectate lyase
MAKKTPTPKKTTTGGSKQLIDAIATVKQLQDFISEHGTLEKALAAAVRVHGLIKMSGGFDELKQALEIVGKEVTPPQL